MNPQLLLEKKHDSLKKRLEENVQKKHALEFRINQEFEELKQLEVLLEKTFEQNPSAKQH
jgi:hypothetical protein